THVPPLSINVNSIIPSCGQCDGFASASASGGAFPYTYLWSPNLITSSSMSNFCGGPYTLTIADANGCVDSVNITYPSQCDSVWPGDANSNRVADNNDVLSIGNNYGTAGALRAGATTAWTAQICANWSDTLASGVNGK